MSSPTSVCPEPEDARAKARLAEAIAETLERRKITQAEAAAIMSVDKPTIALIMNDRLDGFTQDHLMQYLKSLGDEWRS